MQLINKIKIIQRNKITDVRGWFLKVIDGKEDSLPHSEYEIYITSAKENEIRGNHYHNIATEWFTLLSGTALLKLEDVETKEKTEILLDSDKPVTVVIPPKIAHAFLNINKKDFILLAYTNQLYKMQDTIGYEIK